MLCLLAVALLFTLLGVRSTYETVPFSVEREITVESRAVFENGQFIPAEAARAKMDRPGTIVLDVRIPEEFAALRIPGALLLPVDELYERAVGMLPDKNATLLVYCRTGNRSQNAVNTLLALGYTQVFDIGGMVSWPFEVE